MTPLRLLISAYACAPDHGSEPGAGWNLAVQMARRGHDVCVITRRKNRPAIERAHELGGLPNLRFVYHDLPKPVRWCKNGPGGVQAYYGLWQATAYWLARSLHRQVGFHLVHHMTFGSYWMPTFMHKLPIPMVWGPVGGGETTPPGFRSRFNWYGRASEITRTAGQRLSTRMTGIHGVASHCAVALATTATTADRVRRLGATRVAEFCQVGLPAEEIDRLGSLPLPTASAYEGVRLVSIGRLLHWKGFDLGLRAFATAGLRAGQFWIIGDGPERPRLERLVRDLGLGGRVRLWGKLPRESTLHLLGRCTALVHPSLHESGGTVCVEAMAARRPVICLNWGGPGIQVTDRTGFPVVPYDPDQTVHEMAAAMRQLEVDACLATRLGEGGRRRATEMFCWDRKAEWLDELYHDLLVARPAAATDTTAPPARVALVPEPSSVAGA